jgi:hypothetical protein
MGVAVIGELMPAGSDFAHQLGTLRAQLTDQEKRGARPQLIEYVEVVAREWSRPIVERERDAAAPFLAAPHDDRRRQERFGDRLGFLAHRGQHAQAASLARLASASSRLR